MTEVQGLKHLENKLGRGLHIAHLNCQSLSNKCDGVNLHLTAERFDILTLSETWLTPNHPTKMYDINGYVLLRNDRECMNNRGNLKRGGGVGMYIKKEMCYDENLFKKANKSDNGAETQWVLIRNEHQRDIVVVSVYRPPRGDLDDLIDHIESTYSEVTRNNNRDVFILGDFNVDFLGDSPEKTKVVRMIEGLGMTQVIEKTTRFGKNNDRLLDLIITNSDYVKNKGVRHWGISDHELVYVTRKKGKIDKTRCLKTGRSYKNYNPTEYTARLRQADWQFMETNSSVNEKWLKFKNNIETTLNGMCPIKKITVRKGQDPWITDDLLKLIEKKAQLGEVANRTKNTEAKKEYNKCRGETANKTRNARGTYVREQDRIHGKDANKFWKNTMSVWPNDKKLQNEKVELKSENGNRMTDDEAAEVMNNHFAQCGEELALKFDGDNGWEEEAAAIAEEIEPLRVTTRQTVEKIKEIETNKSTGMEHLSGMVVKDALMAVPHHLSRLFNDSLGSETIPNEWKRATVVPIHKKGPRSNKNNYRPISLLPTPIKILEKLVHEHISGHLEEKGLLNNNQEGFRRGRSTISAIAKITSRLHTAMNEGNVATTAFIDFSKAFDTVDHKILKLKLERMGIKGKILSWLNDYLINRCQKTRIGSFNSGERIITMGVPQGSVLGPLLFIIYIDDLKQHIKEEELYLYADDTAIVTVGKNVETARKQLGSGLNKLNEWARKNKITINHDKTKIMTVCSTAKAKKKEVKEPLKLGNVRLEEVANFKYLGITLDEKLNYNKCISEVVQKTSHKVWLLGKLRRYINSRMAVKIYKGMILPFFDYADIIYMGGNKGQLLKLQRIQNRALKICLQAENRAPTELIHRESKMELLSERRQNHLLNYAHRLASDPTKTVKVQRNTRNSTAPLLKRTRSVVASHDRSVEVMAAVEWNKLPAEERTIEGLHDFKANRKRKRLALISQDNNQ